MVSNLRCPDEFGLILSGGPGPAAASGDSERVMGERPGDTGSSQPHGGIEPAAAAAAAAASNTAVLVGAFLILHIPRELAKTMTVTARSKMRGQKGKRQHPPSSICICLGGSFKFLVTKVSLSIGERRCCGDIDRVVI